MISIEIIRPLFFKKTFVDDISDTLQDNISFMPNFFRQELKKIIQI